MSKDADAIALRAEFIAELERISRDISILMDLNRQARSDFDSFSKAMVSRQHVRKQTELLYGLKSCVRRLGVDGRRMAAEIEELRKPDKRVGALEAEVSRLGSELELLRAELRKEARAGIAVRIPALESKLEEHSKELGRVRDIAEGSARGVAKHKLMHGKRKRIPVSDS